jgi:hypothetical protein
MLQRKTILLLFLLGSVSGIAQGNAAARYEIDAKRIGVYAFSKDALPRSREFIRLDSTYYVGYMYEGLYKFERSADYLGYRNTIGPLHKAFYLIQKDFGNGLKQIYNSYSDFERYKDRFDDFYRIVDALKTCYNNIEWPDSTMSLLDQLESYNFQRDFFSINSDRAWTYHRNRFYNSEKFSFLKNSIEENEKMAFECCYKQMALIQKNKSINSLWFGYSHAEEDLMTVYHYIAILHDYNQNYDSSLHYYNLLMNGGRISWGNYAHVMEELGNFSEAISHFSKAQYRRRYSLSEADYYLPSLFLYGGKTKEAIGMVRDRINSSGSTPGFGWYTIALARAYLYDGQLDSATFFLNKAANFRELHIGTTLTQSQYDFTINLLRIQVLDKKISLIQFLDKGWWYSPIALWNIYKLKLEKLLLEYNVVNALANNPERKRLVYDLFCGESTVTFDESLYLLKDFSTKFFIDKYEKYQATDKRQKIYRYFKYYAARFKYENGNHAEALNDCEEILESSIAKNSSLTGQEIDIDHEKLLLARLYEIMALTVDEDSEASTFNKNRMFEEFPQLVPFSAMNFKMNLIISGYEDSVISDIIDDIKDSKIIIPERLDKKVPTASVNFIKKNDYYLAIINVMSANGIETVSSHQMIFKKADGTAGEIILRLFGKGGSARFEA